MRDTIAKLVNSGSTLMEPLNPDNVCVEQYVLRLDDKEKLIACCRVQRLSWYQWEVSHLAVDEHYRRQGIGTELLRQAETRIIAGGGLVAQCTINTTNYASRQLFETSKWTSVTLFNNPKTGNYLRIYNKVLKPKERESK